MKLLSKWTLWVHLSYDTKWTLDSYTNIGDVDCVEDLYGMMYSLNELLRSCMIFFMKSHVTPMWEDKHNCTGGAYSYKISWDKIGSSWRKLVFVIAGNGDNIDDGIITGLSLSPKRNFFIMKVWTTRESKELEKYLYSLNMQTESILYKSHCEDDVNRSEEVEPSTV